MPVKTAAARTPSNVGNNGRDPEMNRKRRLTSQSPVNLTEVYPSAHRDKRSQNKNANLDLLVPETRIREVGEHV
jgi:hypothetical protein